MPKRVLEAHSQEERVQQRKQLGTLRSLTVQPSTRARYDSALTKFFNYLTEQGLVLPRDRRHMDPMHCLRLHGTFMGHRVWSSSGSRFPRRVTGFATPTQRTSLGSMAAPAYMECHGTSQ